MQASKMRRPESTDCRGDPAAGVSGQSSGVPGWLRLLSSGVPGSGVPGSGVPGFRASTRSETRLRQIIPDVPSHATTSACTPLSRQVAPACSDASRLSPATIFASSDRSSQRQPFHAARRAELKSLRGHRLPRAICMQAQRSHSGDLGLAKCIHVHKFLS